MRRDIVVLTDRDRPHVLLLPRTAATSTIRHYQPHQYNLSFYFTYLARWPDYFHVAEAPNGTQMGYGRWKGCARVGSL